MVEEHINKVTVVINGEKYHMKGSSDVEHIKQVAQYVDDKINQIVKTNPHLDRVKLSVLVALNITDELMTLRKEIQQNIQPSSHEE